MSKSITITPDIIESIVEDFRKTLQTAKLSDGKVSYTKTFGNVGEKATLTFSEVAWNKMQTLIREFDKEVGWHGLAYRGEDESKHEYYIEDILIYPQEVTGATVTTDQNEYTTWLYSHDDEVFNNIRMQGHSHVNMGVSPSSVDLALYERILDQLDDDMFYIFLIWNKRGDRTIKIYDMRKNILFETTDIEVFVDDPHGISAFLESAKGLVKTKPVVTKPAASYPGTHSPATTTAKGSEDKGSKEKHKYSKKKDKGKEKSKSSYDFSSFYDGYDPFGFSYGGGHYYD